MKILFLTLLMFFSSLCVKKEPIVLVLAEQLDWAGGRKESGRGTDYTFRIIANKSSKTIHFKNIYLEDRCYSVEAIKINKELSHSTSFSKGDTVEIHVSRKWLPDENDQLVEVVNFKKVSPPISHKGAALLEYSVKSNNQYLVIDKIETTTIQYQ